MATVDTTTVRNFIVETDTTVTRRYRVWAGEDQNPWDVWLTQGTYMDTVIGVEKPVSVERIEEG